MVKITVTLITKRLEPHIDWALESLKNQTFKDFEYIIVDGYYNRKGRKDEVVKLIKDMNLDFSVLHIPEKASRWEGQRPQICNARNTALVFANGRYIVNHDDCTKMPPNWLERHMMWLEKNYLVAGTWIGYEKMDNGGKGIEGIYGLEYRSTIMKEPKGPREVAASLFYGANCSYPVEGTVDINGFDEDLDGEMGQEDLSLAIRLERRGYKTIFDPLNCVEIYMMTHGYEKMIVPVNIVLKDGKEHFSNEFFMERLLDDRNRVLPYGNTIDIKGTRKIMKDGGYSVWSMLDMMKGWINSNKYDWRDGKLIEDKLKSEPRWE